MKLTSTSKERLLKLAKFLLTVPSEQYNQGYYEDTDLEKELDCGFAGCAGGWAAQIPEFQAAGLHLQDSSIIFYSGGDGYRGSAESLQYFFFQAEDGADNGYARTVSAKVFGSENQYPYGRSPTSKQVAGRIRRMVRKYG